MTSNEDTKMADIECSNILTTVSTDKTDITNIKAALQHDYKQLCDALDTEQIIGDLFSKQIVSREQFQHIKKKGENFGSIAQAKLLVNYMLGENDQERLQQFVSVIKTTQNLDLQKTIRDKTTGKIKLKGLKEHLIKVYKRWQFNKIQALPGEKFKLNLDEIDHVMPFNFSAEKLQRETKTEKVLDREHIKLQYSPVQFNCLEEMFCEWQNDSDRSILCTALAGSGKTTFVHSLICQWMNGNELLKGYDGILAIKVRDINIKAPLMEILGSGTNGIGFLDENTKIFLTSSLANPQSASNIIFIIDGADEKTIPEDTELYRLLTGQLYGGCKVFITARPEALILQSLNKLPHAYKVNLKGTTKEGVYNYLKNTITEDKNQSIPQASAQDEQDKQRQVDDLIQRCNKKMTNLDILCIPLYLTLIGYIFNIHWAQYLSFSDLIIPDTTTKLFNSFILILLREWLKVIDRKEEADNLTFSNNPIDISSKVPADIKLKLVAFGKMSQDFSNKQCYTFNELDLKKYLIDIDDIKKSGLFSLSQQDDEIICFYRHRQMQDYMAALFLSYEELNYTPFCDIIRSATSHEKTSTLQNIFNNIQSVIPFLFGLNPEFAINVLSKLKKYLHISEVSRTFKSIVLNYEAMLYVESSDTNVQQTIREVLLCCNKVSTDEGVPLPSPMLHSLINGFSPEQCITLLHNWYNITVTKKGLTWVIVNQQHSNRTDTLKLHHIDHCLYHLLMHFQLPDIHNLHVEYSMVSDVQLLQDKFTQMKYLQIDGLYPPEYEVNNVVVTTNKTLTHVNIHGMRYASLPVSSLSSLVQQPSLQSLKLRYIDMLSNLKDIQCDILWTQLTTLDIYMYELNDDRQHVIYNNLVWLLQHTPKLQELLFSCYDNRTKTSPVAVIQQITDCISQHLPLLNRLCLYNVIRPQYIKDLCIRLEHVPQVSTLGLSWKEVKGKENVLANRMNSLTHIKLIQVLYRTSWEDKYATEVYKRLEKGFKSQPAVHTYTSLKKGFKSQPAVHTYTSLKKGFKSQPAVHTYTSLKKGFKSQPAVHTKVEKVMWILY